MLLSLAKKEVVHRCIQSWAGTRLVYHFNPASSKLTVDERTDLLLDGFGGSANTFAYYAFVDRQPGEVRVAHHTHSPAQFREAVRLRVPPILLIRRPADATLSLLSRFYPRDSRWTVVALRQLLRHYARFHASIRPFTPDLVVAAFDEVTTHFEDTIARLNVRFGTRFATSAPEAQLERGVFSKITNAKPHPERARRQAELRELFEQTETAALLDAANEQYAHFAGNALMSSVRGTTGLSMPTGTCE